MARRTSPRATAAPTSPATSRRTRTTATRTAPAPEPNASALTHQAEALLEHAGLSSRQLAARIPAKLPRTGGGRPSKLSKHVAQTLCEHIRQGNYYETACKLSGISYAAFNEWMLRGEADHDGPYRQFAKAVHQAEAEAEALMVRHVRAAAAEPRNWAAGMTFLERRHSERWAKKGEGAGSGGAKVIVQIGMRLPGTGDESPQLIEAQVLTPSRQDSE